VTSKKDSFTLGPDISRRDFVNGTLVGTGAALLGAAAPGQAATPKPAGVFYESYPGPE
jgi:hypothetical protein